MGKSSISVGGQSANTLQATEYPKGYAELVQLGRLSSTAIGTRERSSTPVSVNGNQEKVASAEEGA
jgi:hypothetical protein